MKYILLQITFLLLLAELFAGGAELRFEYQADFGYQSIIVNGQVVRVKPVHNEEQYLKYAAIHDVLKRIDHPLKLLDLGACSGFFALKAAEDFPTSHSVMIDLLDRTTDICVANTDRNNITYLQKRFALQDFDELSRREHFDVVLILNVIHHCGGEWLPMFNALKKMSSYVIIDIPPPEDLVRGSNCATMIHHMQTKENSKLLGRFKRGDPRQLSYLFLVKGDLDGKPGDLGIKGSTFFHFNGQFPKAEFVREKYGNGDNFSLVGVKALLH
ncbi:MAG: hypothetical protein KR126chlam3_00171 [Chlamydiae bacterium]|nr:hypothetical protein [Chlamydiota bacterium]